VTGELSPEEAARYVERLQRELSAGRRDLVARIDIHRAEDRLRYALL
jgi:3-deoxy-D-arabino-heptulosonate 7-phosphate (DAHP) synthase class II